MNEQTLLIHYMATERYWQALAIACRLVRQASNSIQEQTLDKAINFLSESIKNKNIDRYQALQMEWELGLALMRKSPVFIEVDCDF